MQREEIKKKLIKEVQQSENDNLLEEALRLLSLENNDLEVYKLNEEQINSINEAREQIKTGKTLTDEAANKEINQWLKK